MKRLPFLLTAALLAGSLHGAPKSKTAEPPTVPENLGANPASAPSVTDFQGDDLSLVLRTLARQAGVNVVIAADVQGEVTLRIENKTPRQILDIVAAMKDLLTEDKAGVIYIRAKHPKAAKVIGQTKDHDFNEAVFDSLVPVVSKFLDALLDYEAKPATAQKIAKSKKALLDALIAEGFSREEAFQLVLSEQGLSFFGMRK